MRRNNMKVEKYIKKRMRVSIIIIIGLIALAICSQLFLNFNDTKYTITVTNKERIVKENKDSFSSNYLIFGDDENGKSLVFENSDCLIRGKWDSSNIYGQLKEGYKYEITVVGYRIPLFSTYQNIIKIKEIQ